MIPHRSLWRRFWDEYHVIIKMSDALTEARKPVTKDDVRRIVREELERARPKSASEITGGLS